MTQLRLRSCIIRANLHGLLPRSVAPISIFTVRPRSGRGWSSLLTGWLVGVLAYGPWPAAGVVAFGFHFPFFPFFVRFPFLYIYPFRFPFVPLFFASTCL
ncbi:hypothetical protein V1507DRAFT_460931 [Lipomyces tetrasporus]